MSSRTKIVPELQTWRAPVVVVPLTQAFPELDQVRQFRSRKCIFNEDRSKLFNVVSNKYQVLEHSTAVDIVTQVVTNILGEPPTVSVNSISGDARIFVDFQLPGVNSISVAKGDLVRPSLKLRNSYDGTWGFSVACSAKRLVCENGMMLGHALGSVAGKHFPVVTNSSLLETKIERLIVNSSKIMEVWNTWRNVQISYEAAVNLVGDKFPLKYMKPILIPSNFPKSVWDFYNDLTYMSTHQSPSLVRRIEFDDLISSLFYKGLSNDVSHLFPNHEGP